MKILQNPPSNISACTLYQLLKEKSTSDDHLSEKVDCFLETATPLLELTISGPFKNYTLHSPYHSLKLVYISSKIIDPDCLKNLSALECATIICSCYLHDMGMAITSVERQRILKSGEYQDFLKSWPELWDKLSAGRSSILTAKDDDKPIIESYIYQLHEAALSAFLRPRHAEIDRYKIIIESICDTAGRKDLFCIKDFSFENFLIDICVSHNTDVGILAEVKGLHNERFPREVVICGQKLNTQFCAAVLRLSDILDFDYERTPKILFENLGFREGDVPGSKTSIDEWKKHLAVHTIEVKSDELIFSSICNNPTVEASIRKFCKIIEREVRDTQAVLKSNKSEIVEHYKINLPLTTRSDISSVGYTFKEVALNLNQAAIMSLLMGENLYSNKFHSIRELIQNSLDACAALDVILDDQYYKPLITLKTFFDDAQRFWIEVKDNGIGMDEHVITEYFFRIGNSYYDSPEFERMKKENKKDPFIPTSRFGIGILSVFMIADKLSVKTKSNYSPRKDNHYREILVDGQHSLAHISELKEDAQGTTISIRVRSDIVKDAEKFEKSLITYLKNTLIRPIYPIEINTKSYNEVLSYAKYYQINEYGKNLLKRECVEPVVINVGRWSNLISGIAILFFLKTDRGLHHLKDDKYLKIDYSPIIPHRIIDQYIGSRLTVNGFAMVLRRSNRLLRRNLSLKLPMVIDIDVKGERKIEYDVTRTRIIGKSRAIVRREIYKAVTKSLKETNIVEQLHEETKMLIYKTGARLPKTIDIITDQEILEMVMKNLPTTKWQKHLHKAIAKEIGISNTLVSKAISTLIGTGKVIKP